MSVSLATAPAPSPAPAPGQRPVGAVRRGLRALGRGTRRRASFVLMLHALLIGVVRSAVWPSTWRPPVRAEFRRALVFAIGGGLTTVILTGVLVGASLVSQALYWLTTAGQTGLIGDTLVNVLVREITPVLVGLLMLGRSGAAAVFEVGSLRLSGQWRVLEAQGIDPFAFLILPRAVAMALASFALGVVFAVVAMLVGFAAGSLLGQVTESLARFIDHVMGALDRGDFSVFLGKMLVIGAMVALVPCLTAIHADTRASLAELQSRGFLLGLLAVLMTSVLLSLVI